MTTCPKCKKDFPDREVDEKSRLCQDCIRDLRTKIAIIKSWLKE